MTLFSSQLLRSTFSIFDLLHCLIFLSFHGVSDLSRADHSVHHQWEHFDHHSVCCRTEQSHGLWSDAPVSQQTPTDHPITAAGDSQPITASGDCQPITAAGDSQPVTASGDCQPITASSDSQPITAPIYASTVSFIWVLFVYAEVQISRFLILSTFIICSKGATSLSLGVCWWLK